MNPLGTRLTVLHVVVIAMLVVLTGRLWQVQVMQGTKYASTATATRTRNVMVPAVRGQILDAQGRPLVRNRTALVVSIDRMQLQRMPDGGREVLKRLAAVLERPFDEIEKRVRPCGPGIRRPCWPGSPYQPIPVHDHVSTRKALQILERQEEFPGVIADVQAIREYPLGRGAAQALGYLQPVTQEELERRQGLRASFSGVDLVGRDGLEAVYDEWLRGKPGLRRIAVDRMGREIGIEEQVAPVTGDTLITSIDGRVQRIVETAITRAVKKAPRADGAAGVVLDAQTGRVVALASYPSYDPSMWVGGLAEGAYERLLSAESGRPLVSRATHGTFAPGSTFKISSVAAAVYDGYPLNGIYDCPGAINVGSRAFHNFRGIGLGPMNLKTALIKSCDTIFYRFAYQQWLRDGGMKPRANPKDPMQFMARQFGFGRPTGVDLPGESGGRIPDRTWKTRLWEASKQENCTRAKTGYPEVAKKDPSRAGYLKTLANENCLEGFVWRPGDAANFSIGQGDVLVTPLQLAQAYAAIASDGKLRSPRLGWALVRPDGRLVKKIDPPVSSKLPISSELRNYIKTALAGVPKEGTAAGTFSGFPLDKLSIAGKTGTAEVYGKADTGWFATFAPADKPRYVVVAMVSQGGLGGGSAGPAVREIYEKMFGISKDGKTVKNLDLRPAVKLPTIRPDGTVSAASQ
ncbi:penicillin-binding protein 2 [Rhizohabitans arisaemae]|uniref:penicillin-binding protein 2 n=1 Tax=Rhizohabitans arisaemae TaxID=2720610 RepID=UPI0024B13FFB|nr:penicillin-binding protein 2 [Rhizohabitans arisaemae]